MLRVFIPVGLIILFLFWVLYSFFIKKDLKKNMNSLYTGLFFIAVWAMIYFFWMDK